MADTIRGNGLVTATNLLLGLAEDQQRLDRARRRFSDPPPTYTSYSAHGSTRSQSPDQPSEEEQDREKRRWQLITEQQASLPYYQRRAQETAEKIRILEEHDNGTHRLPVGTNFDRLAHENVKERWVAQGIWNNQWNETASLGRWKHEEPLEAESDADMDIDIEAACQTAAFSFGRIEPKLRVKQSISNEDKRKAVERRAAREHEREASRHFFQFIYQVSQERSRSENLSRTGNTYGPGTADINTKAYENVKNIWMKRKIWNNKWGILPGMAWKHEEPLDEDLEGEFAASPAPIDAEPAGNGSLRTIGEVHCSGPQSLFERQARVSDMTDTPLDRQIVDIGTTVSMDRHAETDSPPTATTRARARLTSSVPSRKDLKAQSTLGISKVSKATAKKQRTLRQLKAVKEGPSDNPPRIRGSRTPRPPVQIAGTPQRRSERLQYLGSVAKGSHDVGVHE